MEAPIGGSGARGHASALAVRRRLLGSLVVIAVALSVCTCSNVEPPSPSPLSLDDVEHELSAFDGVLLGADRGEFGGYLVHRDHQGNLTTLLRENVHGIVENEDGIFVLTGLSHLGMSAGNLYQVRADTDGSPRAVLLGHLPGAPSHVTRDGDGPVRFLIEVSDGPGESLYQCHTLQGAAVSYSNSCEPPLPMRERGGGD